MMPSWHRVLCPGEDVPGWLVSAGYGESGAYPHSEGGMQAAGSCGCWILRVWALGWSGYEHSQGWDASQGLLGMKAVG